jgi:serine protease
MPYVLDAGSGCGANSVQNQLDGFSIVGGHEYAEAVTDPEPASGWVDSSGQEIGDLCAWQGLTTLSLPSGSYAIQPLWSNNAGGCVASG